jgi:transketolase
VLYHGSLAGIVPGGPGHSHQSVRDIALFGSIPGMVLLEPYCEQEVALAVEWAVREATGPVYIRLVSVPWELPFEPPPTERLEPGRGTVLRRGTDVLYVTTGPVLVGEAWRAADLLAARGIEAGLVALPWLRDVDGAWLRGVAGDARILALDNHVLAGGQGDALLGAGVACTKVGIESIPLCGTNDEVLRAHGLDAESLAARALELA